MAIISIPISTRFKRSEHLHSGLVSRVPVHRVQKPAVSDHKKCDNHAKRATFLQISKMKGELLKLLSENTYVLIVFKQDKAADTQTK